MNTAIIIEIMFLFVAGADAQRQMEHLGRGMVAVNQGEGKIYVGWRMLGTDPENIAFDVYRSAGPNEPVRLNSEPLTKSTNFVDNSADLSKPNSYFVRPVLKGKELAPASPFTLPANAPVQQYLSIPLQIPAGGTTPDGAAYTYIANDCSVGDLDGDGEYEFVLKWEPSGSRDNARNGYTGSIFLDAYKLNGARLWRIDLGKNIRSGAHYTQFMVYDLDGDGKSEVACKTAPGTIDGYGKKVILPGDDPNADYRDSTGRVLAGPEYLTVFNGQTGAAIATTNYIPPRGHLAGWGDNYGNRVDRFLACIAYLDGQRPSFVACRGYYARSVLAAWNFRDGKLTHLWTFDSDDVTAANRGYRGQGNHNLAVGDVDGDGKDEIVYGACCVDDNGKGLYTTGLGHGDAMHLSDLDPNRAGLEVWQGHEVLGPASAEFRDAATGKLIWGIPTAKDCGRALAADIDPCYPGYEVWAGAGVGLYDCKGKKISSSRNMPSINFAVWWDGDLLRELLDGTKIYKWDYKNNRQELLFSAQDCASNNGTKANPCLCADILGDWREEVVWRTADNSQLRIFTTTIPADRRFYTFMHDPVYRLSVAWQNVGYNQPTQTGFYFGDGMSGQPRPSIKTLSNK
jgi:rhamnogalacturonan endolyase